MNEPLLEKESGCVKIDTSTSQYLDLLFLKTDGTNKLIPITPQMLKAGRGFLDNTNAKIRMMPQQVKMFEEADSWPIRRTTSARSPTSSTSSQSDSTI